MQQPFAFGFLCCARRAFGATSRGETSPPSRAAASKLQSGSSAAHVSPDMLRRCREEQRAPEPVVYSEARWSKPPALLRGVSTCAEGPCVARESWLPERSSFWRRGDGIKV
ncbi:uncharacterized protein LOC125032579 [Penaeus chinensis]|uniref:uncharacterized protein LOC125032579 n=1 Tax=Penaeus chinensis TaxID=139456 RepID=UPI001FB5D983|nr:uncharacterized protein LOC125032579 [Penaeus chinensis]